MKFHKLSLIMLLFVSACTRYQPPSEQQESSGYVDEGKVDSMLAELESPKIHDATEGQLAVTQSSLDDLLEQIQQDIKGCDGSAEDYARILWRYFSKDLQKNCDYDSLVKGIGSPFSGAHAVIEALNTASIEWTQLRDSSHLVVIISSDRGRSVLYLVLEKVDQRHLAWRIHQKTLQEMLNDFAFHYLMKKVVKDDFPAETEDEGEGF